MSALLIRFIRVYQMMLSSVIGPRCRFYPSCSEYAAEALATHGASQGSLLAIKRICKCHPFHPGGVDMVPAKLDSI